MRRYGLTPRRAIDQVCKRQRWLATDTFEPLPTPVGQSPYRLALSELIADPADSLVFYVFGDSGGVGNPAPQQAVAKAVVADAVALAKPTFLYHLGDVVYFNGADDEYQAQFYEPYESFPGPILAIPGNHDGDPLPGSTSLQGFVTNFVQSSAHLSPDAGDVERDTMTLPNVYWTLTADLITIIGLYSNVPSGGVITSDQEDWLAEELKAAPADKPVVVTLHHPPFSADAMHGGCAQMLAVLDDAAQTAGRQPSMVLSGHVHNYQRFTRKYPELPYIVAGAGGYHNLHQMASNLGPLPADLGQVSLDAFCDSQWGYLRLDVTPSSIVGAYYAVALDGSSAQVDSFIV